MQRISEDTMITGNQSRSLFTSIKTVQRAIEKTLLMYFGTSAVIQVLIFFRFSS